MKENKKGGAGKFFLGAALGALAGAIAGKFVSQKCDEDKEDIENRIEEFFALFCMSLNNFAVFESEPEVFD